MPVFLVICYPVLIHLSILLEQPLLQAVGLTLLAAGLSFSGLLRGNKYLWLMLAAVCGTSILLAWFDHAIYFLYVPPVALPLLLLVVFVSTLLPGQEALVTAIGEASRGPLTAQMRSYTKVVTWMWVVIFILMIISNVLLPIFADNTLWSWVTSVGNYIFVGLIFVGEFIFRRFRFPTHNHPGFIEYLNIVLTADVHKR